jgi:hypothetical protein
LAEHRICNANVEGSIPFPSSILKQKAKTKSGMIASSEVNTEIVRDLYWNKNLNVSQAARRLGISVWSLYDFMNKNGIKRRSFSDAGLVANSHKPQFHPKDHLTMEEQGLKIAGSMLYWAEGTFNGATVDFANSNPEMIKVFLRFLREICGIDDSRLRVYLYAYSYCNLDDLKLYWHRATNIPLDQFTKPYIREGNPNLGGRKLTYGVVHIRYNGKRLLLTIRKWVDEYIMK